MNIQQHLKAEFDRIIESYESSSDYSSLRSDLINAIDQVMNPEPAFICIRFYKDEQGWFADVPNYPGPKADLAMVQGADTFLDILSDNGSETLVHFMNAYFEDSDSISILELYELGGAIYEVNTLNGSKFQHFMWLCDVTKFVFETITMPHTIYFKKLK